MVFLFLELIEAEFLRGYLYLVFVSVAGLDINLCFFEETVYYFDFFCIMRNGHPTVDDVFPLFFVI